LNQGIIAFYRGQSALIGILTVSQTFKFFGVNTINNSLKKELNIESEVQRSLLSATISSVLLTTMLYPLDLAHTRMSTDMSKKESMYVDRNETLTKKNEFNW